VLFWNAHDLERKLADFQAYYNAARSRASLEGHTPLTFAGGHTVVGAELNNVRLGLPLPGPGPAPSGGLTTNSDGQVDDVQISRTECADRLADWPFW
jgi:hypothetical protein